MNHVGSALDYMKLAQQHKPSDPTLVAAEIRRLSAQGLKPRDVASHLGVHVDIVLRAVRESKQ